MGWGWRSRCCCLGRRDLLCVLALLAGCLLPVCRTRVYTNHWAVKIAGGFAEADRIASKYGFINVGQVTQSPVTQALHLETSCWGLLVPFPRTPPPFPDVLLQLRPELRGDALARSLHNHTHARSCWGPCLICFYKLCGTGRVFGKIWGASALTRTRLGPLDSPGGLLT